METRNYAATSVETVAVFKNADTLQNAIDDLLESGFDRADLSMLGPETAVAEQLGHNYLTVAELEDDAAVLRSCYIARESIGEAEGALVGGFLYAGALTAAGAIFASGGSLSRAIEGAVLAGATGGVVGLALAKLIDSHRENRLRKQLDRGGLVLWVRTRDVGHIKRAVEILCKNAGRDVHVHAFPIAV